MPLTLLLTQRKINALKITKKTTSLFPHVPVTLVDMHLHDVGDSGVCHYVPLIPLHRCCHICTVGKCPLSCLLGLLPASPRGGKEGEQHHDPPPFKGHVSGVTGITSIHILSASLVPWPSPNCKGGWEFCLSSGRPCAHVKFGVL